MGGLVGYGAYVPYYQLERTRIAGVLGSGGGSGTRSVAAFDEDKDMLEAQERSIALDPSVPIVSVNADQGSVQMRRLMASFIEREQSISVAAQ